MAIFRRGADYVEAFRWAVDADLQWFCDAIEAGTAVFSGSGPSLKMVVTSAGADQTAQEGDWIIRGLDGTISTCGDEEFRSRYVRSS